MITRTENAPDMRIAYVAFAVMMLMMLVAILWMRAG